MAPYAHRGFGHLRNEARTTQPHPRMQAWTETCSPAAPARRVLSLGSPTTAGVAIMRMPRRLSSRIWGLWMRPEPAAVTRWLVLAGLACLFLQAAATVQVAYTIQLPYALLVIALIVGFPFMVGGWRTIPSWARWSALGLLSIYALSAVLGHEVVLTGSGRAGHWRDLIYIGDLVVGLGTASLLAALWTPQRAVRIVMALSVGVMLATLYSLYQWPAQKFGLPFSDINNTLNTNGLPGAQYQGTGLLGWQRVRGTFVEPTFLAAYLASLLPVVGVGITSSRRPIRWIAGAVLVGGAFSMLLTSSASAWVFLVVGLTVALAFRAAARGRPLAAATLGGLLACLVLAFPLATVAPGTVAGVTGRSNASVDLTTTFRTSTWKDVVSIWSYRPVLGYGPGQSSVRLTQQRGKFERRLALARTSASARQGLLSAQGLWAASLIDTGVVGFTAWMLFLGAVGVAAVRTVMDRPSWLNTCILSGLSVAILGAEYAGDRLDLRVWALIGLALLVSQGGNEAESERYQSNK